MVEMSMNRVIHAAFRRDLSRFENALATFADGDSRRAEQLSVAWTNFNEQLTHHHKGEHTIAWPTLRQLGITDELITRLDAEHERMAAALATADGAMQTLRRAPTGDNAKAARDAMSTLRGIATEHLDHEEAQLEPIFLDKKDTAELKAMGRQFSRELKPPAAGTFMAWLQDGASGDEVAALRQEIPGPIVTIFSGLFGRTYRRTVAPVWRI
jgi:hemerythrin-like domain-containing protein